ncbi:hypothetical protein PanWU01x14_273320 [Parasponia andersonii]|uniref:Uncharacterized protein n=1 Tax=Parasponia andersonii TaxID=3476 RepID=A0A2P5B462_PARAD|nr:hypothetical protein PanWU01x14_273320 [Parasponia andersonii]
MQRARDQEPLVSASHASIFCLLLFFCLSMRMRASLVPLRIYAYGGRRSSKHSCQKHSAHQIACTNDLGPTH